MRETSPRTAPSRSAFTAPWGGARSPAHRGQVLDVFLKKRKPPFAANCALDASRLDHRTARKALTERLKKMALPRICATGSLQPRESAYLMGMREARQKRTLRS